MRGIAQAFSVAAATVLLGGAAVFVPSEASGDSLGEYKEEKHSGGTSGGSSDDDEDDDDSAGEIIGGLLSAIASSDDEARSDGGTTHTAARSTSQACRFDRFYGCMAGCEAETEKCRKRCRRHAEWICGSPSNRVGSGHMTSQRGAGAGLPPAIDADGDTFSGEFEMGSGFVEGGVMLTTQNRLRWGIAGLGVQASYMFSPNHRLFEADFGPAFFAPVSPFVLGIQPSALVSFGNDVRPLVGGGARLLTGWRTGHFMAGVEPMLGVINEKLNLHLRSSIGYRFGSTVFAKIGHDFRFVRELSGTSGSSMHGGFVSVGLHFD